jgi:hypothetical protein
MFNSKWHPSFVFILVVAGMFRQCDIRCGFFSDWFGIVKWISNQFCMTKSYVIMYATIFGFLFTLFKPHIVMWLLKLKSNKCTLVTILFYKTSSTCSGPWRSIIRSSAVEYKHCGIMLYPSIYVLRWIIGVCYEIE